MREPARKKEHDQLAGRRIVMRRPGCEQAPAVELRGLDEPGISTGIVAAVTAAADRRKPRRSRRLCQRSRFSMSWNLPSIGCDESAWGEPVNRCRETRSRSAESGQAGPGLELLPVIPDSAGGRGGGIRRQIAARPFVFPSATAAGPRPAPRRARARLEMSQSSRSSLRARRG